VGTMPPASRPRGASQGRRKRGPTSEEAQAQLQTLVDELFKLADVGGTGSILFGDFLAHHEMLSDAAEAMQREDYAEVERNFRRLDKDANGHLDKQEFSDYMDSLLAVLGQRSFLTVCKDVIEQEKQRRATAKAGFDWRLSDRLLEQARGVHHYRPEMKEAAYSYLEQKADPNLQDHTGSHALLYAADKADADFVARLLEARANPQVHNDAMDCAAFRAARGRNLDVLSVLLQPPPEQTEQADAAKASREEQQRVSRELVRRMSELTEAGVHALLSKRASINYKDTSGWTPLTAAVFFDKPDHVEVLLRAQKVQGKKLRLSDRNAMGRSALHIAVRRGHIDLIMPLVRSRGDPDIQDVDGWTPLHHAAYNGRDEVVPLLLEASADLNITGRGGLTPFQVAKLPTKAADLSDATLVLLRPPPPVDFTKCVLPVLQNRDMGAYHKMQALLGLPGVFQNANNLRLHDHFFDPRHGPNKVRLRKMWEGLALPLIERLYDGVTDLEPLGEGHSEEACADRLAEIAGRQREQKHFVLHWLLATKGLRPSESWTHENRGAYGEQLQKVLAQELADFAGELEALYEQTREQDGGEDLAALPAEDIIRPECSSQLSAHPIPLWLEKLDTAGAFEALRLAGAFGAGRDDDDAMLAFVDLVSLGHDFGTGRSFWRNVYRLWLSEYAQVADVEFQKAVRQIVEQFNRKYNGEGLTATYRGAPVKTYERMKAKERQFGEPSHETYMGRVVASRILDVVRASISVATPRAALILLEEYFRPLNETRSRFQLVRVVNRFAEGAETLLGYRNMELSVLQNCGVLAGRCGRPGASMQVTIIGEVQINLEAYLAVRKRRHLIYKCSRGEFDWPPQETDDDPSQGEGLDGEDGTPGIAR